LLQYLRKDERYRGEYKKHPNSIVAYDAGGKEIGVVFETASPFDTSRLMEGSCEVKRLPGCVFDHIPKLVFNPQKLVVFLSGQRQG